jgi:glycogen debranching enzyme
LHFPGLLFLLTNSRLQPDFNRTLEIDVPIYSAGAFAFYTTYTSLPDLSQVVTKPQQSTKTPLYYIDVASRISLDGSRLPLSALSIFSVISKFMGKYPSHWQKHLRGIGERGYNMVHFTPLNQRGASNSPYSIYDQLAWDPGCFPNGEKDIVELVDIMEHEHGLLGLTDVVWNHTAHNSKWLQEHPEVGYNVSTAPWLESALVLDTALLKFGKDLAKLNSPVVINNINDLLKIMDGIKTYVIGGARLWEYYVIEIERDADAIIDAWASGDVSFPPGGFGVACIGGLESIRNASQKDQAEFLTGKAMLGTDRMGERYRRRVNPPVGAALITAIYGRFEGEASNAADKAVARNHLTKILDEVNLQYYREYDEDVAEILEQIFNRVKYVRLDDHGPKLGAIDDKNPLIETYFTRLPLNSITKNHKKEDLALVNNGWIWAANVLIDNAGPSSRAYLRREVIVWGDCVKLRYESLFVGSYGKIYPPHGEILCRISNR